MVRYIGQTVQPLKRRYHQHLADAKRCDFRAHRWIRKELRGGFEVQIIAIEKNCEINVAEKKWIALLKNSLVNTEAGGKMGHVGIKRSKETKQKMSRPKSPQARQNMSKARVGLPNPVMSKVLLGNTRSRGEANRHAVLKDADVKEIKKLLSANHPVTSIAKRYGVQKAAISKIKVGRTWSHIAL